MAFAEAPLLPVTRVYMHSSQLLLKVWSHPGEKHLSISPKEMITFSKLIANSQQEVWLRISDLATTPPAPPSPCNFAERHYRGQPSYIEEK